MTEAPPVLLNAVDIQGNPVALCCSMVDFDHPPLDDLCSRAVSRKSPPPIPDVGD
eukprot:CAMPEP_0115124102 /NCGR_PEP_ID=MMETSP0227-20121206/48053_1 /TAXON_ID=89957 /ORGANISM="Polarella glacialis, Strain CCMP 1383" /LENGTH=54 /DNA_ID=CAMNT_0002526831 /DNA_START=15 /DNA_END=176 /DNA_ORIENTATION=+